jgi:hypothetical protein
MDYMDCDKEEKAMKERPILFNGEMVRAILEGRKVQTRRPIKNRNNILPKGEFLGLRQGGQWCTNPNPNLLWAQFYTEKDVFFIDGEKNIDPHLFKCPFGQPGDRLWVRETWAKHQEYYNNGAPVFPEKLCYLYKADGIHSDKWRPSIHMPREASRITLEIDEIRVERVQDITNDDAYHEGTEGSPIAAKLKFKFIWDDIYSKQDLSWRENPWVWAVKFHVVEEAV